METNGSGHSTPWMETKAGKKVQAKLSEERTLQAIDHLLDRIDTLDQAVQKLNGLMKQGPGMVAMVGDMADETYRKADAQGINIDERLKNALHLAEKLTAPEMVQQLDGLLKLAGQAPGLMAMVADMTDEAYRKADTAGISLEQRLGTALQMAEKLTAPETANKLDDILQLSDQFPGMVAMLVDVLDEGMQKAVEHGFNPNTLAHISGVANTALTISRREPPIKVSGIFSLFRAMKDPGIQKGMGFFLNFLKHFGQNL